MNGSQTFNSYQNENGIATDIWQYGEILSNYELLQRIGHSVDFSEISGLSDGTLGAMRFALKSEITKGAYAQFPLIIHSD